MSAEPPTTNWVGGSVIGTVVQAGTVRMIAPASHPVAVAGLPAQTVFVGREAELAELTSALRGDQDAVVVWSVGGLPGVGKTALAVCAAQRAVAADWFPGGVVMTNLRGYDSVNQRVSAATALAGLLGALGVASEHIPPELDDRAWLWRSMLAERAAAGHRMLILADNASHPDQVRPLLPGTPGHKVLITSRHRLAGLDGTRLLDLDVLGVPEAVAMLTAVLEMSDPADDRALADPVASERVARSCGGLPLAVRVSAALLVAEPEQSMSTLADALADGRHRLTELDYGGSLEVRAAFDLSYDHLDPAEARVLRLMALDQGPDVGIGAVAAVAEVDEASARRLTRLLRGAHLLQPGSAPDRWRMHDLVRLHAADKATVDPDHDRAITRLLDYYLNSVIAVDDHFGNFATGINPRFAGPQEALAWMDAEYGNIVAMTGLADATVRGGHVVGLAMNLYEYFDFRKQWDNWVSSHRIALRYAEQGNNRVIEARLLVQLGIAHVQLTQFETAASLFRRALGMFRQARHRAGFGWTLNQLGVALREMGRWHFALACHRWSFDLFNEVDSDYTGNALHNIAVIYRMLGQLDSAAEIHKRDAVDRLQQGNRLHQGRSLNALGVVYRELGRTAEAMDCHRENLAICREFHDFHGEGRTLANLAAAYRDSGVLDEAIDHHLQAVRMFQKVGHRYREGLEYKELGLTYRMAGQEADAVRCVTRALEIFGDFPGADAAIVQETRAALGE